MTDTPNAGSIVERTDIIGTLDELEPILRDRGYTAVRTMAGSIDLAQFDPYGMRRPGSINLQGRWALPERAVRLALAFIDGRPYLADAQPPAAGSPFVGGLFPLITEE